MKTTTVPAQVTTVEDKIAGSLTLSQLFLLIGPIFIASAIYLIIPPTMHLTIIKCGISFFIWLISGIMAIRAEGQNSPALAGGADPLCYPAQVLHIQQKRHVFTPVPALISNLSNRIRPRTRKRQLLPAVRRMF